MKINYGLILATLVSTSVMAQVTSPAPATTPAAPAPTDVSPTPPPVPPETNAPAKKKTVKKKPAPKKKPAASATAPSHAPAAPLMANQPAVVKQDNINVRGQAHINSEAIGHLKKGETVTVLEEVTITHPKTDEPAKWARIAMPSSIHVWVNTSFLDTAASTVKVNKLNLRTGAGENYSVIGMLHKGDAVKTITTKGDWTEIEAPASAFAFVAAHLLEPKEGASSTTSTTTTITSTTTTEPTHTVVDNNGTIASAPGSENPGNNAGPGVVPVAPLPNIPAPQTTGEDRPAPKRIVEREGVVGGTVSIQSPSHYALKSLDNGRTMDYLYTTSPNVQSSRYKGLTVLVTGEESLDERWPDTPVITIQKIQVVK